MKRYALTASLLLLAGCAGGPAKPPQRDVDISLARTDTDGKAHDLDATLARGRPVALVFWQTWCESCNAEAPVIRRASRDYGEAITFVGVIPGRDDTVDDAEVEETRRSWGYDFPQLRDRDMSLTRAFGVTGTPTIVVLGRDRHVVYSEHEPPSDWGAYAAARAECQGGVCPLPTE